MRLDRIAELRSSSPKPRHLFGRGSLSFAAAAVSAASLLCSSVGCSSLSPMAAMARLKLNYEARKREESKISKSLGPPVLSQAQSAEVILATAREMERAGNDREAAALYEQARTLSPEAIDYPSRLSRIYDRLNIAEKAEQEYEAATTSAPDDADLLNDRGMFHLSRGEPVFAERWFRKALEKQPDHRRAAVNLAGSLALQNRLHESYDAYSKVVGAAAAHSNIGVHLARLGRIDEARASFSSALEIDGTLQTAQDCLNMLNSNASAPLAASK
jgi:Tfp pilus assembly protein PilF